MMSLAAVTQGPHSHILMTGGGPSDFFGSEILAKVIFWVYERRREFLGHEKKQRHFWRLQKKRLRDFWGYAIKRSDFWGSKNPEVVIFFGYKI